MAKIAKGTSSSESIKILLDPTRRQKYLEEQLQMDGLDGFVAENPTAAYCALSLTNTPSAAKAFVKERQTMLKQILEKAGLHPYDPATAPLSPDLNLTAGPEEVYRTDLARVAGARFFTAFDTFPSTGVGVELEAARRYNRIAVIFHDEYIRTSRMQPNNAIHLTIRDLFEQKEDVTTLFHFLKQYEPGRGLRNGKPLLLGFKNGKAVDLAATITKKFPKLVYTFDGTKPAIIFGITSEHVFLKQVVRTT